MSEEKYKFKIEKLVDGGFGLVEKSTEKQYCTCPTIEELVLVWRALEVYWAVKTVI